MPDVRQLGKDRYDSMKDETRPLALALKRLLRCRTLHPFTSWDDPAMNVLDCVLSLNRRYKEFVVPRLEAFADRHPEVMGISGLRRTIRHYQSPAAFSIAELNY